MTERAITIQPGMVTPLGDALPAGTSVFNLDSVDAVWISTNPGVIPGQGAKVGAFGSIQWQGGPCYAVPDTGVTAPVSLTLSDQATNPVNPVDVGAAVAVRLGQTPLTLDSATTGAIGTAVGSQSLTLNSATTGAIGSAVASQSLTLTPGTTGAIGSAVASQSLTLNSATTGAIGSAVAAQSLTLAPATTTAIGSAVAAPSATSIASAVAAQSLKIGSGTITVGNPVSAASIGTAVAGNPLKLDAATTNAIGTAVASQSLTVGNITGGNVQILNTSAIGNDVAVNVNTLGVPGTFIGNMVFSGIVTNNGSWTCPVDVSKYSTLNIVMSSQTKGQLWNVQYWDSVSGNQLHEEFFPQPGIDSTGITLDSTPRGNQLRITWTDTTTTSVSFLVFGSNRIVPEAMLRPLPYWYGTIAAQSWTQFQTVNFSSDLTVPDASLNTFRTKGGLHNILIETNSAAPTGFLYAKYMGAGGVAQSLAICAIAAKATGPWGESMYQGNVTLPRGTYALAWQNATPGAALTYSLTCSIIPTP